MVLNAYRHGLRASELCDLQWHQVELGTGRLQVRRTCRAMRYALCAAYSAISARFCHRAQWPFGAEELPHANRTPGRAGKDAISHSSTHAATCLRLRTGERGARHPSAAGVARTSQYPAHGALHGISAEPISRFLAGLKAAGGLLSHRRSFIGRLSPQWITKRS